MTPLARLITRTRMEAAWQTAVLHQRLLERLAAPTEIECPCGAHQKEVLR